MFEEDELIDEELVDGEIWSPEPELEEDAFVIESALKALPKNAAVKPSQFTEHAFQLPDYKSVTGFKKFSFDSGRHMRRIYDTPAKRILLCCGRQVGKSTLIGNITLCYCCMIPSYRALYVSASSTQAKVFSNDRLREPIETSPILKRFTTTMLSSNILEKQFVNRSKITLRYAYLNADRVRGIPAYLLAIDEFQDILSDNIPIIEQCLFASPEELRRYVYSGTPKSLDNNLEFLRANKSTQGEWVVPCDRHTPRHWNILGEKNIGKYGLVCERCKQSIDSRHPDAQWAKMVKEADFESYRIPQLIAPTVVWDDILYHYKTDSRQKFYNEVLGISYDSGLRPLTTEQVRACCNPDVKMIDSKSYRQLSYSQPVFAGLDHGTGEHSYSVLVLATYVNMKFRVFYVHRFVGEDVDPEPQLAKIVELLRYFNVKFIGSDYGGGFDRNDHLVRKFGPKRVWKYQYLARAKKKVEWDSKLGRFKVHRTEVMSDIFNAIKRKQCEFPAWEEFDDPYARDMLNIYAEYNNQLHMTQYGHRQDKPDDTFHAFLYAWLVSMMYRPRPDILTARREDKRGFQEPVYSGPIDQG